MFDFTSPYAYLLSERIDEVATRYGRVVNWQPILLGPLFRSLNMPPLIEQPGQAAYAPRDLRRSARFLGVEFAFPPTFPVSTVHAARAFYAVNLDRADVAKQLAHALFRAYFVSGRNIGEIDTVLAIANDIGLDREQLQQQMHAEAIKNRLRQATDDALANGVFGAPWVVIDDEVFWGADRLPQIERWLAEGGF